MALAAQAAELAAADAEKEAAAAMKAASGAVVAREVSPGRAQPYTTVIGNSTGASRQHTQRSPHAAPPRWRF